MVLSCSIFVFNKISIRLKSNNISLFFCSKIRPGRSPVFSHLTATINGLATIRARNIQNILSNEFDRLQDAHSAVWQLGNLEFIENFQ